MIYARERARASEQWINRSNAPILSRGKIPTDPFPYFSFYAFDVASAPK